MRRAMPGSGLSILWQEIPPGDRYTGDYSSDNQAEDCGQTTHRCFGLSVRRSSFGQGFRQSRCAVLRHRHAENVCPGVRQTNDYARSTASTKRSTALTDSALYDCATLAT